MLLIEESLQSCGDNKIVMLMMIMMMMMMIMMMMMMLLLLKLMMMMMLMMMIRVEKIIVNIIFKLKNIRYTVIIYKLHKTIILSNLPTFRY
jgi:hypothetical protein